jgi:hypothetical protein
MYGLRSRSIRGLVWALSVLALGGCSVISRVRDPSHSMADLDSRGLEAYQSGELTQARDLLNDAVSVGKKAGLARSETMARTYLHLGAVFIALDETDQALRYLGLALRIQPSISPGNDINSPPLRRTLALARTQVKSGRGPAATAAPELPFPESPRPVTARATADALREPAAERLAVTAAAPAAPVAAPPEPAAAAAPELKSEDEPELPATISEPLHCVTPDEAPPAVQIPVRCVARPGIAVARMVLYHRAPGSAKFTAVAMARSRQGWYQAMIPPTVVAGKSLQYYVEAHGTGKRPSASAGDEESPNLLLIRANAPRAGQKIATGSEPSPSARPEVEENPLALADQEHALKIADAGIRRRGHNALWFGVGGGTAYGWHPTQRLELHDDNQVGPGFSPAGIGQITPEIGVQLGTAYAVSIQARFQFIPESGSGETTVTDAPKHSAFAVFARLYRFFGRGQGQPFVTGTLGGGEAFRLKVPPHPELMLGRSDTVRGGPVALGPGLGYLYQFNGHFAWAVEARVLLGIPTVAALGELSTGAQLAF